MTYTTNAVNSERRIGLKDLKRRYKAAFRRHQWVKKLTFGTIYGGFADPAQMAEAIEQRRTSGVLLTAAKMALAIREQEISNGNPHAD